MNDTLQNPLFGKTASPNKPEVSEPGHLWRRLEELIVGVGDRAGILATLGEERAIRESPLVAYVVIRMLDDADDDVREQAIRQLGVAVRDNPGEAFSVRAREIIVGALGKYNHRDLFNLLQSATMDESLRGDVGRLLNLSPKTGELLADVAGDRSAPLAIRKEAIYFIGQLGFAVALPTLERLANRIEARQKGQGLMPFAAPAVTEDQALLPALLDAVQRLQQI